MPPRPLATADTVVPPIAAGVAVVYVPLGGHSAGARGPHPASFPIREANPVKRTSALTSLSHDHHQALVVAHRLRRATPDTAPAAHDAWKAFWPAGQVHFRAEEEVLLPAYAGHANVAEDPAVTRVLLDHVVIRHHAIELERHPEAPLKMLHALGEELNDHVRLEERELFPRIETALPADALTVLADELSQPPPPT